MVKDVKSLKELQNHQSWYLLYTKLGTPNRESAEREKEAIKSLESGQEESSKQYCLVGQLESVVKTAGSYYFIKILNLKLWEQKYFTTE